MAGATQVETRGVDRNFRLFREDQVAGIRDVLDAAENPHNKHSGPRPITFTNASLDEIGFSRGDAPNFKLSFDAPQRIRDMRPADLVRPDSTVLHPALHCYGCTCFQEFAS